MKQSKTCPTPTQRLTLNIRLCVPSISDISHCCFFSFCSVHTRICRRNVKGLILCAVEMVDAERRNATATAAASTGSQSQAPTRLQSRAPASIDIKRGTDWNVAIPLLSPLVSPSGCGGSGKEDVLLMGENKGREMEAKGTTSTNWKHPAAPFCYGPVPRANPFVPV